MAIERLAAEDEVVLWADAAWPQDIGALAYLDGRALFDADGRFRLQLVRAAVAARLHLLPRFRQLLVVPPAAQGGPLWADAPAFDVARHVRVTEVPAPGGEPEVLRVAERLVRAGLDRSRPLWEMWFLTGLEGGRVGWFVKLHHCIADGIAGVASFATFLDLSADAPIAAPEPWTPAPAPTEAELVADAEARRRQARSEALAALAHPVAAASRAAAAWPAMRELFFEPSLPPTSLTRRVGPERRLALVRGRLDDVKAAAHAGGAKVNDVLLAALAGALGDLLAARGEPVPHVVRAYVPVTLRPLEGREAARGNLIGQMTVPLPAAEHDPARRLRQVTAETALRKTRVRPPVSKVPHHGRLARLSLRLIDRQRVNVTTADLPGPPVPLFLAGAPVLEVFPILPLIGKVALGVAALSYAGQFNITVVGDGDAFPDLSAFADALGSALPRRERTAAAAL